MSAWAPSRASSSSASEKSIRRKRVSHATSRAKSSKRSSAAGSRSTHTSVPVGPMRSATKRAWPPSPKVQSTASSPGPGWSTSINSPASTGTCVLVMSRRMAKVLRDPDDLAIELLLVGLPAAAIPDLEVVDGPYDHHLLADSRVLDKRLVERHATRRVELHVPRVPREVGAEPAPIAAQGIEVREEARGEGLELLRRPDRDAGLDPLLKNHSVREGSAERGGHVVSVLRVERVVELPAERQWSLRLFAPWRWT